MWAKNAWGYMHLDDEQFHYKQLQELCEHVYIAMYGGLPVGMLAVIEKSSLLKKTERNHPRKLWKNPLLQKPLK